MFIDFTNPVTLSAGIIITATITAVMVFGGALLSIFGKMDNIGPELMKMSLIPFLICALFCVLAV